MAADAMNGGACPESREKPLQGRWYVLQVRTGREAQISRQCQKLFEKALLEECFIPKYEQQKRYQGSWHKEQIPMFPGYLFLITEKPEQVHEGLRKIPELTKILKTGESFVPVSKEEQQRLQTLIGDDRLAEGSVGYIENEQIIITSGPLKTMSNYIRKIDRHKRTAELSMQMFGRNVDVKLGLEVVRKG